ncbi:hypothetical protein BD769DRAFT_1673126 [Suillus cothurnatus]|nr:hypothetical protein BD769DRAFT_1673126 [Suillus cothurnatus]
MLCPLPTNADWRAEAKKIVVLITDPTPHGIEDGDEFPEGCHLRYQRAAHSLAGSALEAADGDISLRLHKNSVAASMHVDIWFNAENLDEAENPIQFKEIMFSETTRPLGQNNWLLYRRS